MPTRVALQSTMARTTADSIRVKGHDLCQDILGKLSLGDMAWLEIFGSQPSEAQSAVFNALLVVLVEHGMTPMAITARLTYLGAPESMQSAIAAGLLGMGSRFAGTSEDTAKMLQEALKQSGGGADLKALAAEFVRVRLKNSASFPGLGHPIHKPTDPRTVRLFEIAAQHGVEGIHSQLLKEIEAAVNQATGKRLPINAPGAVGAIALDLGLDARLCRGLAVIGRSVGLLGHLAEEMRTPIAYEIFTRIDEECSRPVSDLD